MANKCVRSFSGNLLYHTWVKNQYFYLRWSNGVSHVFFNAPVFILMLTVRCFCVWLFKTSYLKSTNHEAPRYALFSIFLFFLITSRINEFVDHRQ
jgi:hypothetical protein